MDIRPKLDGAARRYKAAKRAEKKAAAERDELIRQAIAEDVPRAEIAQLADVAESRVYQIRRHART